MVNFHDSNFHCFLGFFEEHNVWKCWDQQGRPTYTTLTVKLWSFVKLLGKVLRFLMMNFTFKLFWKQLFSWIFFVFEMQKRCFPIISMFSVLYSISVIFLCSVLQKIGHTKWNYYLKEGVWSVCMNLVHLEVLAVFGPYFFTKMLY